MRVLIHAVINPLPSGKAPVSWWADSGQRIVTTAVALALALQIVPLAPPPPSQVVTVLLADAPPPISSRAPFLAQALAPLNEITPLFTSAPMPVMAAGAEITKTAPSEVDQGDLITYTLAIRQSTGSDWPGLTVYVTDTIPANTNWVGCTGEGWFCYLDGGVAAFLNLNPVAQGTWITVGLGVTATKPLPNGTIISNTDYAVSATVRATGLPVTTEVRAPAFSINKTASSASLCAGNLLTYTLSVSNVGRVTTKESFTISDVVPSNVSFVSASDGGSYDPATRAVTWTDSTELLKNGGTTVQRSFVVSVPHTLADGTPVQNITYTVYSNADEVTPAGVGPASVVTVSKVTAGFSIGSPACVGSVVSFINTSTSADSYEWDFGDGSPAVTDTNPTHVFISTSVVTLTATGSCGTDVFTDTVTVSPLPTPTLQINPATAMVCSTVYFTDTDTSNVVTRTWDFGDGEITTTVSISTTSHSYAVPVGNYTVTLTSTTASGCFNTTQEMITLTVGLPASITLTADPPALPIGQTSLLTATVTDCGGNPVADGTVITFTSSPGWSGVSPMTGTTSNGVATSTVIGAFPGGAATVTATAPTLVWMTTTVEFHAPDLTISKGVQLPTVVSSDTITYTLFYTNVGLAPAQDVCLTDTLPVGVSYGGWVGENPNRFGSPTYGSGPPETVTWCTSTLASGAYGTIVITATVDPTDVVSAIFTNTAEITTTTPESDTSNNVDQASNQLSQAADVVISKAVTPVTILHPNDVLTYTLTFTNVGHATAAGVIITDVYQPLSLTNVTSSYSPIVTPGPATPPTYTWTVLSLGPGEGGVITITARVDSGQPWPPTPTTLTNTAFITTTTPDGNASNDSDQETSTVLPGPPQTVNYVVAMSTLPRCGTTVVTATVTDQWGNPVQDGTVVSLTNSAPVLTFQENGSWTYHPTTVNGVVTTTLVIDDSADPDSPYWTWAEAGTVSSGAKPIDVTADIVLTSISVTATPNTLPADGSSTSVVAAQVTHCGGGASGEVVTFTISPLGTFPTTPYTATTNASGIAVGTLTAPVTPTLATVTATVRSLVATTTVTFTTPTGGSVYLPIVVKNWDGS